MSDYQYGVLLGVVFGLAVLALLQALGAMR